MTEYNSEFPSGGKAMPTKYGFPIWSSVLLFAVANSLPALRLLDGAELQALVAHEIGHGYLWQEFAAAERGNKTERLRELELAWDAIAVLTLERVGVKPDHLIHGLEKVARFNRERFGLATNENSYPWLSAGRKLVKAMSTGNRALIARPQERQSSI